MSLTYTKKEIIKSIKGLVSGLELARTSYLQTGSEFFKNKAVSCQERIAFLEQVIAEDKNIYNI